MDSQMRQQAVRDHVRKKFKGRHTLEIKVPPMYPESVEREYQRVTNASLFASLKTATSVRVASDRVLLEFERPADQSEAVKVKRAGFGQKYYDKYAGAASGAAPAPGGKSMTENELRSEVVSIAVSYLGCKESDGSHKKIIDLYNSHKPLARGYPVKYTDAWCSTFASAVAIKAGLTDIIPTECGCEKHIQLFKALGSWQENDAYVPKPADYVFYDWDDNGASAYFAEIRYFCQLKHQKGRRA